MQKTTNEEMTTIAIPKRLMEKLDKLKIHKRQPINEVIENIYDIKTKFKSADKVKR